MIKKIAAALLLAVIITGGTGCMIKQQQDETEPTLSVNGQALTYMEEKYGEKFYYYSPWGNSLSDTRQFLAVCDSIPDQQILVQIDNYRTDNKVFRDNYLAVKYQQKTIDYLHEKFSQYYSSIQVIYVPSKWALSPELVSNADFETYLADKECSISSYIVLDINELKSEDCIEAILKSLEECKGSVKLSILFLDNIEVTYCDPTVLRDIVRKKLYVRLALVGIEANNSYIIWKEGI